MKRIAFMFMAAALACTTGHAQITRHVLKDGLHFGYPTGGDVRNERAAYGLQVGHELNEYFSTEVSVTRQEDKIDDLTFVPAPYPSVFDLEMTHVVLSGRIGHPYGPIWPYFGAGIGYYYMRADNRRANDSIQADRGSLPAGMSDLRASVDMKNTFGYHLAFGVEWMVTPNWELFAEFRRVFLDSTITYKLTATHPTPGASLAVARSQSKASEDFSYDHTLVRLGFNYRF